MAARGILAFPDAYHCKGNTLCEGKNESDSHTRSVLYTGMLYMHLETLSGGAGE